MSLQGQHRLSEYDGPSRHTPWNRGIHLKHAGDLLCEVSDKQQTSFAKLQVKNSAWYIQKLPLYLSTWFWHILLNQKYLLPRSGNKESKKLLQRALADLVREFWKIQFPILKINHPKKRMLIIKRMIREKTRSKFANTRQKKTKKQNNVLGCYNGKKSSLLYMSTQTVTPPARTDFWKSARQVVQQSMAAKSWHFSGAEWIGMNTDTNT